MRKIPKPLLGKLLLRPRVCARNAVFHDHECQGRLTLEHVWIYGGKQINEEWAIIWLCAYAHDVDEFQDGGHLDKEKNQYASILSVTEGDLEAYPKKDWGQIKRYLFNKYGEHKS